jgi:hypothetical protein
MDARVTPIPVRNTKKAPDAFVKLPLWFAREAAKATNTRKALVWIWLVRLAFENRSLEFPVPNARLAKFGVSKHTKLRALREMEAAGLIRVTWSPGKTTRVTLITL